MFERFWNLYPRKVSKGAALKAWTKLSPNTGLAEEIIKAVGAQKEWRARIEKANSMLPRWQSKFLPDWKHAATWLRAQCWLDELEELPTQEKKTARKTYCTSCQKEEGKYPVAGVLYCIKCYDRAAYPENYATKLRVVK